MVRRQFMCPVKSTRSDKVPTVFCHLILFKMYCDWPEFDRCCFCLPLRKGILIFGYISIIVSAFMIGLYSYTIHHGVGSEILTDIRVLNFPAELCITIHCAEMIFDGVLLYGAHMKSVLHIKVYYYFAVTTTVAVAVLQFIDMSISSIHMGMILELLTFTFANLCIQIYLIISVRSLLKRMEISGPNAYDNQLHQVVSGELKVETNGVYNNTTSPADRWD